MFFKSHFENLGQISSNFFVNPAARVHFERKEVQIVNFARKTLSLLLSRQLRWLAESWARVCVLVEMVDRNTLRMAHCPIADQTLLHTCSHRHQSYSLRTELLYRPPGLLAPLTNTREHHLLVHSGRIRRIYLDEKNSPFHEK